MMCTVKPQVVVHYEYKVCPSGGSEKVNNSRVSLSIVRTWQFYFLRFVNRVYVCIVLTR